MNSLIFSILTKKNNEKQNKIQYVKKNKVASSICITNVVVGMYSQPPSGYSMATASQYIREAPTVLQETDTSKQHQVVPKLENPLGDKYVANTACQHCFKSTLYPGVYEFTNITHKCEETMLAMKRKDGNGPWIRIRERGNHRDFPGNYIICNSIKYREPAFCKYGEEICSFAHSEEEKYLWTLEKDGFFNITEFLIQNRKYGVGKGFSLKEVLGKHGGYFEFICRCCYYGHPPQISYERPGTGYCGGNEDAHPWKDFRILAHVGKNGITVINPRGFLHKSAFFKICRWVQYCRKMVNASCKFAHSVVERDVWMVERDTDISRDDIVTLSKQPQNGGMSLASQPVVASGTDMRLPQQTQNPVSTITNVTSNSNLRKCLPFLGCHMTHSLVYDVVSRISG